MNASQQEIFFQSVRDALQEGINLRELFLMLLILGSSLALSAIAIFLFPRLPTIKRFLFDIKRWVIGQPTKFDQRYAVHLRVKIIVGQSLHATHRLNTSNLSTGGMFIKTSKPFEMNTSFSFQLDLNNQNILEGTAIVRWVAHSSNSRKGPGMGCEFVALQEKDVNQLRFMLRRLKQKM